ncbi:MAG TPA: preprotein translocase subunit SecG [Propylenella sp.]
MTTVLIVIHLMVVLAMIGLVLLQRSEGGALGIGGGGGGFMTGRGVGNVLTRATGILALAFFATSLGLALLAKIETRPSDIFDRLPGQAAPVESQTPAPPAPTGAPTSAQDLLEQLGGPSQAPEAPAAGAGNGAAAPAPAPQGGGAAPQQAPAAPASGPQTPPAAPQDGQ